MVLAGYIQTLQRGSDFALLCIFNYVICINPLFLLVNVGLRGENLFTETIYSATKVRKMGEVSKVSHKKLQKNFRG